MTIDYPTDEAPATPEYVLEVLRDGFPFYFPEDDLTAQTPLVDLACAINELSWPRTRIIADGLNAAFDARIPLAEWKAAFPRLRGRTVGEVCEFLAGRITRPVIRPWRHIAGDCLPAGAFLTVRSMLTRRGVDPSKITPGAALDPHLSHLYTDGSLWDMVWNLSRAAPGRLPPPEVDFGLLGGGGREVGIAILAIFAGLLSGALGAAVLGCVLFGLACVLMPVAFLIGCLAGYRGPRRVELPGLSTFRDLAYVLAGQEPRRRIQPSA